MNETTPEPTPDITADIQSAQDTQIDSTDSTDTTTQDVNWQQRFKDTQSAYTKGQQELAEMRRQLTEYVQQTKPALDYYQQQAEFEEYKRKQSSPSSVWDQDGGIDGAIAARDREIERLKQEHMQTQEMIAHTQSWQVKQQFKQDQYKLYKEFGGAFGSEEAFAEILKELPKYDPNWEQNYLNAPSYDTLARSYFIMKGAAAYDPNSVLSRQEAARKEQDFLQKQGNYLGGSEPANIGPSQDNPGAAYMSPMRQ